LPPSVAHSFTVRVSTSGAPMMKVFSNSQARHEGEEAAGDEARPGERRNDVSRRNGVAPSVRAACTSRREFFDGGGKHAD
jgi:hypothetical protein